MLLLLLLLSSIRHILKYNICEIFFFILPEISRTSKSLRGQQRVNSEFPDVESASLFLL